MDKYLELKEKILSEIKANLPELITLNDDLADHPEVSGQEFETSRKIVELLRKKGFETEYPPIATISPPSVQLIKKNRS